MDNELDNLINSELDRIYRYIYNRTYDAYKAEDITQDIVTTAYQAYPRLRDKSKTLSWLWGITRNVYMQSFKSSNEIPTDEVVIIDIAGISYHTPEIDCIRKSEISKMRRAVSYLAKSYRDVCVMFWLEGKDYNTISNELSIPLSSVKWRLNQSKSQLREEYKKMDYMNNGYRKAVPLKFNMGGWVGKWNSTLGSYDNADKALEGLLPQNICLSAYDHPKTVTEISSELGVAADYVEEALTKLVGTQSIKQTGNKFQTMFPVWDAEINRDVFDGNIEYAIAQSKEIVDAIYSLSEKVLDIGFCGCDKGIDKLILFLIGYISHNTIHNNFETDKLPFQGNDKAWYILATKEKEFSSVFYSGVGINSSSSMFGLTEYCFVNPYTEDNRCTTTECQKSFYDVYLGNPISNEYLLSKHIEDKKIIKNHENYKVIVPVLSTERREERYLFNVLSPVFEMTNDLQTKIYKRSCDTVKKYIPKHIQEQSDFFGSYCCNSILETTLFRELISRNVTITTDMATWFIVK